MNFRLTKSYKSRSAGASERLGRFICALLLAYLPFSLVCAGEVTDPFSLWPRLSDQELAKLRGGFITADGLNINIGLEQLVMIDGTVKTHYNFDLSGLGGSYNLPDPGAADQNKRIQLIQNGDHNQVTPDIPANFGGGALTVIQNSLDAQLIQNFTVLKLDVSGMSQFRSDALGRSIGVELIRSLR